MKLSLCTISFRHQLVSITELAQWAARHQFQGIELWGVHAGNLRRQPVAGADWLHAQKLKISMISDYLPLTGDLQHAIAKTEHLGRLAQFWQTSKIRTFAGDKASVEVGAIERRAWAKRLRSLCDVAEAHGTRLVVETHPNSLADTLASTVRLLEEVDHPALRINFDVIHIWESGADALEAFTTLKPFIVHMHLKNVTSPRELRVFNPANVYAPAGDRKGMTGLFEGCFDFRNFLRQVLELQPSSRQLDASLEWFGPEAFDVLARDSRELFELQEAAMAPSSGAAQAAAWLA